MCIFRGRLIALTEKKYNIQASDQNVPSDDQGLKTNQIEKKHMERRRVLQLGIAGMPMMLSMRASAQSFANSALDCTVTIPADLLILVHEDGRAWITDLVRPFVVSDPFQLTLNLINRIQNNTQYSFVAGSVPREYLPMNGGIVDLTGQYALYRFPSGATTIEPGTMIDAKGNFNVGGAVGLYLALTVRSIEQGDSRGRLPGASCVISILDYVNQQ